MASTRSPSAALTGLPSATNSPSLVEIEQLSEELGIARAVLASLHEIPDSSSRNQEIADVKAEIARIQQTLAETRRKGSI